MVRLTTKIDTRLTEEEYKWIDYISTIMNCSKAEAIRWMINTVRLILNTGEWSKVHNISVNQIYGKNKALTNIKNKLSDNYNKEKKLKV
ncbi:MAG: hypothetical protein QXE05_06125 [Nitrososphaeria archaeon]